MRRSGGRRLQQAGLSIVELMVGVTIGLIVVAAASLVMSTQLVENRKLLIETQLQQDLRATADIITRELRRAGSLPEVRLGGIYSSVDTIWMTPTPTISPRAERNQLAECFGVCPNDPTFFGFNYWPPSSTTLATGFGFKLDSNVIKTLLAGGTGAQELTDANVMRVTAFSITPQAVSSTVTRIPCPKACPDGTGDCWPTFQVRDLVVKIEAEARRDPAVTRAISSNVRVRNDFVQYHTWPTGNPNSGSICPL